MQNFTKNSNGRIEINYQNLPNGYQKLNKSIYNKFIVKFSDQNGNSYYFKENNMHSLDQSELIMNIIRKAFKLDTIEIQPASLIDKDGETRLGVISKDLLKNPNIEKIINGNEILDSSNIFLGNSVQGFSLELERFKDESWSQDSTYIDINLNQINTTLLKEFVLGFRSLSEDIYEHAFNFLLRYTGYDQYSNFAKYELKMLPRIDNSQTGLINSINLPINLLDIKEENRKIELIENVAKNMHYPFMLYVDREQKDNFETLMESMQQEISRNSSFKQYVEYTNNLDIKQIILDGIKEYENFEFDSRIIEQYVQVFDVTKELINNYIMSQNSECIELAKAI